jgi:hypothetical protein
VSISSSILNSCFHIFLKNASDQAAAEHLPDASKSVMMPPVQLGWVGQASWNGNVFDTAYRRCVRSRNDEVDFRGSVVIRGRDRGLLGDQKRYGLQVDRSKKDASAQGWQFVEIQTH